ncbi:hypothetical protein MJT46_011304 [Ovis ammon polii x Ovis aries]|nr:hypothetical protein MJT46_011304 [Ovis ammon polii x Ovis aries]
MLGSRDCDLLQRQAFLESRAGSHKLRKCGSLNITTESIKKKAQFYHMFSNVQDTQLFQLVRPSKNAKELLVTCCPCEPAAGTVSPILSLYPDFRSELQSLEKQRGDSLDNEGWVYSTPRSCCLGLGDKASEDTTYADMSHSLDPDVQSSVLSSVISELQAGELRLHEVKAWPRPHRTLRSLPQRHLLPGLQWPHMDIPHSLKFRIGWSTGFPTLKHQGSPPGNSLTFPPAALPCFCESQALVFSVTELQVEDKPHDHTPEAALEDENCPPSPMAFNPYPPTSLPAHQQTQGFAPLLVLEFLVMIRPHSERSLDQIFTLKEQNSTKHMAGDGKLEERRIVFTTDPQKRQVPSDLPEMQSRLTLGQRQFG